MRLFLLSTLIVFSTFLNASALVATVQKANGNVKVKSEGSLKKTKLKDGDEIKEGDLISTSSSATAVMKLVDGSFVVLDASSSIHFAAVDSAEQKDGKVYYKITSRNAKNSLKITTPFAIIGIKGTTFIINAKEEEASVSLKEGLVGVQSIKEEFELYRKQVEEEFNNYVSDEMAEFEAFKKEGEDGVAQMTKEFDLKEGNTISFAGQKVKESGWTAEDDAEFDRFEELINSI